RDWFRLKVWKPAIERAGITFSMRAHDLRHAHASWLLAGGADLQMVKDRLGHGSLSTTEKYLHTLPEADDMVLDAFSRIHHRARGRPACPPAPAAWPCTGSRRSRPQPASTP